MKNWIERQKYLLDYALASAARRKAKNASLLLVFTGVVFVVGSVLLAGSALREEAGRLLAGSPEVVVQKMVAGRHDLMRAADVERIGRVRGVQRVTARLWGYHYDAASRGNLTVVVEGAGTVGDRRVCPQGTHPSVPQGSGSVAVGGAAARVLGARVGEELMLEAGDGRVWRFRVREVFGGDADIVAGDTIVMEECDFRGFFGYPEDSWTDVALSVANERETRTVAAKVAARVPGSRVLLRSEMLQAYESIFTWREGIVLVTLVGALLAFAIFALEKASGLSGDERREIGILKAIGWETGDVIKMKLMEGAWISVASFLMGTAGAYVHVARFGAGLFAPVMRGWSVVTPQIVLSPGFDGALVATLFLLTVLPYGAATLGPVWRAASMDPDTVMRGAR